jgi:hypothetical protein
MLRSLSKSFSWVSCSLVLASAVCFAQASPVQIETRLAGNHGRDWIYKTVEMFMGPGDKCKQGERYRFKADHTVVISQCIDSQMHTETQTWSVESVDPLETHVKVGDTSYILRFWDTPKGHFMALRTKFMDKTKPTIDKEFQLAEE